ncbi:MAG: hypothetical protein AABW67_02925 [Nanoarchaeota archaeon]
MRKIINQEQKDKKTHRNQLIIGLILIGLMLFSSVGYAFSERGDKTNTEDKLDYNGISFVKTNGYWNFNLNGKAFITQYNPNEVKDINFLSYSSISDYIDKPLYFSSVFNEPIYEINRNINSFVLRVNNACMENNCSGNFPIKNCSLDNVIVIKALEENNSLEKIYQEKNCIFINAGIENQTRYADAFLFKILGV